MMKAYPEYKDSGVEWLGEVPSHWDSTVIKRKYDVTLGKMLCTQARSEDDTLESYLKAVNIQPSGVLIESLPKMWFSSNEKKKLRLMLGDLLISEGGDAGRSAIWEHNVECYIQNAINRVRGEDFASNKFLYYWMTCIKSAGLVDIICNKSTIPHYTAEKVEATECLYPPKQEIQKIVNFLDLNTSRIDNLIAEKENFIKLLEEKRQVLISHVVTKGLNPNVQMKDSGVDWIREIPEHWDTKKLAYICRMQSGDAITSTIIEPEGEFPVYGGNGIRGFYKDYNLDGKHILIGRQGALCGNIKIVNEKIWASEHAVVVYESIQVDFDWFGIVLEAMNLNQYSTSAAQPGLSVSSIMSLKMPFPPKAEQKEIAKYFFNQTKKIEALVDETKRSIELLKEHRSALISAAVTGKIDVREEK